jgi:hypothetical protein
LILYEMKSRVCTRLFLFSWPPEAHVRHHVMSQARAFLRTTPAVQDIPSFESTETGYAKHEIKRKPANTDSVMPLSPSVFTLKAYFLYFIGERNTVLFKVLIVQLVYIDLIQVIRGELFPCIITLIIKLNHRELIFSKSKFPFFMLERCLAVCEWTFHIYFL